GSTAVYRTAYTITYCTHFSSAQGIIYIFIIQLFIAHLLHTFTHTHFILFKLFTNRFNTLFYISHFQNGEFFKFSHFSFSSVFEHFLLKLFCFQCVSCVFNALCIFLCTFWFHFHWLSCAYHMHPPLSPYASHMSGLSIGRIEPLDSTKGKRKYF